jgi:hypothetical protein
MRKELGSFVEADGLWQPKERRIILKRAVLASIERYAGALLHEVAHAVTGAQDVNRNFEDSLTTPLRIASPNAVNASG